MVTSIGIVGLGLIGGSLARRAAARGYEVLAWNHTPRPYETARRDGIQCVETLEGLAQARPELLILCNPLKAMPSILARLAPAIDPDVTTLSDVGSVKGMVREQVSQAGLGGCYVGAHPMAGNEHSGFEASDPALYDGALWAITVDADTEYRRFADVARFITNGLGNELIVLDDATHDRAAALISHMPHAVATAMINELCASPERNIAAALAAGSWRDMTRVALTDPNRTRAMIDEDRTNVEVLLRSMAARLLAFADDLQHDDGVHGDAEAAIAEFFSAGQSFRDFKAQTARGKQTVQGESQLHETTLDIDPARWQSELLESAKQGERITRFLDDRRVTIRRQPII
ncbi:MULTISPECIES: prephenate dehydrogenase [Bifidobacterium]|uniref:Prephenate dehydrogenase/arogenate dehydrogenase family protein n=1 Tax=Bifidobacterium tibiigranuli TaxID=2172043 RepID=A0A5N6S525_9BIFI|nr:prephenate dehydrogenase/arogenate dehydrogenase family protein [Bifidobacterium tibiigranuli]KAE8128073.1 prephenate dehydrogenase/arogenate dehydrogenase family protein [Bifidobacterium tibiigranuli]KAE8128234.1 prephenate dehydrogenase/arogenate dehydrogenase family protein [Bifidobacterium tibiigranuli]MCH3974031.1 prephenate dehydrogenase/arogenate dehydrogenase family protein [Bifidobacterium tibiigranuli]MCH4189061.1 prephenate dehydrogenase/arogenate dehydrogenase family protein [Bif